MTKMIEITNSCHNTTFFFNSLKNKLLYLLYYIIILGLNYE
jgi:hypothetical protein